MAILPRNLLGTAAFALVAWEARLRSGSWRLGAPGGPAGRRDDDQQPNARTQNWSWLPFGPRADPGRLRGGPARAARLLALPPLMAFWVNAHGAFVLGLALLAIFAAGETLRRCCASRRALGWPRLRWLYRRRLLLAATGQPARRRGLRLCASLLGDRPARG